jgi:hypothetical protein
MFSVVRDRSPRLYARIAGLTVMWWPQPPARAFRVRRGGRCLLAIDAGHFEILVG